MTDALKGHLSDCALHNAPALPVKPCDCGFNTGERPKPCSEECEEIYPYYGVAPHDSGLGKRNPIGGTVIDPQDTWPSNFVPDQDDRQCGTYYCPECRKGV
jgi:hypothetical protein